MGALIELGGQTWPSPLVLSPMVDVTDAAFRSIARECGADITCSEMVAAASLIHDNPVAWSHVAPWPKESPYGVQFMTGNPEEMAAAIRHLATRVTPDFVDINLGCPAPNILRSEAGGFLLRDPDRARRVMRAAKEAADEVGIPHVSIKLRKGHDDAHLTFLDVGRAAQEEGMSWATLHGRTVAQGYRGHADWNSIAQLVDAVDIPIIGNGDLRTPEDVTRMRDETQCAGFFIARAAMHDPTVFARMRDALEGRPPGEPPTLQERVGLAKRYLERAPAAGVTHIAEFRRQLGRFMAGAPGAKKLRIAMHASTTSDELLAVLDAAFDAN